MIRVKSTEVIGISTERISRPARSFCALAGASARFAFAHCACVALLCSIHSDSIRLAPQNHQRAHHVVFLVFKDVAVPNIFIAASPRAGGHGQWHRGKLELHVGSENLPSRSTVNQALGDGVATGVLGNPAIALCAVPLLIPVSALICAHERP